MFLKTLEYLHAPSRTSWYRFDTLKQPVATGRYWPKQTWCLYAVCLPQEIPNA